MKIIKTEKKVKYLKIKNKNKFKQNERRIKK